MNVLAIGSSNLPYSAVIKSIPVDGDRGGIGQKFNADMGDFWRRFHFTQSMLELQIMYGLLMFTFSCLFEVGKVTDTAQN
jgi:hypothetical protein